MLGKYGMQILRRLASKTWEHTRQRKKPAGAGSRVLTDVREVFEFNAWYLSVVHRSWKPL